MSTIEIVGLLGGGILILLAGAEALIRGSSSLAIKAGITPLVVGLTVVAFGTSSPELVVSLKAALDNNSGISLGNVIGSNIANIALILGLAAIVRPMKVESQVVRREIPFMIITAVALLIMLFDGELTIIDGIILIVSLIAYTIFSIYNAKKETSKKVREEFEEGIPAPKLNTLIAVLLTLVGLGLLILGADLFVNGAVGAARNIGVSDVIIGLTIVAVGTSLPELITSVVASLKKEADIALGNIVGSNIFNILCILGLSAVVSTISSAGISVLDFAVMILFSVLLWPMSRSGFMISRLEGILLLTGYVFYIGYIITLHYALVLTCIP